METSLSPLIQSISSKMHDLGFKLRGQVEFVRIRKPLTERLAFSLRKVPSENAAFVEGFAGFNFANVEDLAASLQGKKPRPGFMTCSLNIGLLTPEARILEWMLSSEESSESLAPVVLKLISESVVPFWDEFSTLERLSEHCKHGDSRLCRGAEWPWRCAAVYALLGQPSRAINFLQTRLKQSSILAPESVLAAIQKLSLQEGI